MSANDRSVISIPRQRNIYQGPKLPLLTEEEIVNRADYYAKGYEEMDRLREGALRGYKMAERARIFATVFWATLYTAAGITAVIGLYGLFVWVSRFLVDTVLGR